MFVIEFSLGIVIAVFLSYICFQTSIRRSLNERTKSDFTIQRLVESSKDVIYHYQVKPEQRFIYLSPSLNAHMDTNSVQRNYTNPMNVFDRIHPDDYETLHNKVYGHADYTRPFIQRWQKQSGEYVWFEEYSTPVYENGEFVAIEGIMRNITEKVELQQELEYRISHDILTGVYNRNYFQLTMDKYNKDLDTSLSIILCDIDNLKYMNDTYGHKVGDKLISESAKILKHFSAENVIVSRVGGDEFAILIADVSEEEATIILENIDQKVLAYNAKSTDVTVGMSKGSAFSKNSVGQMEDLFVQADKNMYLDKRTKKSYATTES